MSILKKLSIVNESLRRKLMIAFSLMTVIPLLACVYLISPHLVPEYQNLINLGLVILTSIVISILGLVIASSVINSVIDVSVEARKISEGDFDRRIDLLGDDEVGSLGQSINAMTKKIKTSLDELKGFGMKMKEIHVEIQKKIAGLSSLLQLDDIISAGSMQIDSVLELGVEKVSSIFDTGFGALYMSRSLDDGDFIAKVCFNLGDEALDKIVIKRGGTGVLENAIRDRKIFQVYDGMKLNNELEEFRRAHNLRNFVVIPLFSDKAVFGLLITGNCLSDFKYSLDDMEMITVFAKHMTIAIEKDMLDKRSKELTTKDDLTGLFNKRYVLAQLEEEIKRAIFYQRPCSFVVFRLDNFKKFRDANNDLAAEDAIRRIAKVIKDNIMPIGKAARIDVADFALLLPEKNKRETAQIAEEMRKRIENVNLLKTGKPAFSVLAGFSENPIDGATGDEIFDKAVVSLTRPKPSSV